LWDLIRRALFAWQAVAHEYAVRRAAAAQFREAIEQRRTRDVFNSWLAQMRWLSARRSTVARTTHVLCNPSTPGRYHHGTS